MSEKVINMDEKSAGSTDRSGDLSEKPEPVRLSRDGNDSEDTHVTPEERDIEAAEPAAIELTKTKTVPEWENDPENPLNWPTRRKILMVTMLSSTAILAYVCSTRAS